MNGEPITRAQLQHMAANPLTVEQAQRESGVENPDRKELERLAMQKLVDLRLLVQEARRRKITVTQDELDEAIGALRRRFGDLKDFGTWIQQQGISEPELFETLRTDMLAQRATAALVEGVRITEEQTRQYFEAHRDDLVIGAEVRLRIIAVKEVTEADEIVEALRKGEPFDRLARRRSKGLRAARGGDTGWVDARTLPTPLRQAATELKDGEVGGPFHNDDGDLLIVGVQGRRPVLAASLAEARTTIEPRLLRAKQQETLRAWLDQQKKKAKIETFSTKTISNTGEGL